MRLRLSVNQRDGRHVEMILGGIENAVWIGGEMTLWFASHRSYDQAKRGTGWEDGHDEHSLLVPPWDDGYLLTRHLGYTDMELL